MTGTHLIDIKDSRLKKTVEWIMHELDHNSDGEVSVTFKKAQGKIVAVEKTVKEKEK